jgi:hypothetical protein
MQRSMNARNFIGGLLFVVMVESAFVGCMNQPSERDRLVGFGEQASGATQTVDSNDDTLGILASGAFRTSPDFTHVSSGPYPSTAAAGAFVDLWVSTDAYADYQAITPTATGTGSALPLGAIIVRVVTDASGDVTKLTLMRHGPAGINPTLDDWWFAETDPNGVPLTDDAGPLTGPLAECMTCHLPRASNDYLFGVPTSAR